MLVLVGGLIILGPGLAAFGLDVVQVPAETEEAHHGVFGHVHLAGGIDNAGATFVTSGEPGYKSQTIVANGFLHSDGSLFPSTVVCSYQYRVSINGQDVPQYASPEYALNSANVPQDSGKSLVLQAYPFALDGRWTGALRVDLVAKLDARIIGQFGCVDSYEHYATDGAALVDGSGSIRLAPGQSDVFEEGQAVQLSVESGEGHWVVQIFDGTGKQICPKTTTSFPLSLGDYSRDATDRIRQDPSTGTGAPISNPTPAPNQLGATPCADAAHWDHAKKGSISFTVPSGAFRIGGGVANIWHVSLRNQLIEHAAEQLVVIDKKILAPEAPSLLWSNQHPDVGSTEILTLTARANPGGRPIQKFVVSLWYGDTGIVPTYQSPSWIAQNKELPATEAGTFGSNATYAFTVQNASRIQVRAYAVDADGRVGGSILTATDRAQLQAVYCPQGVSSSCNVNDQGRGSVDPKGALKPAGPGAPATPDSSLAFLILLGAIIVAVLLYFRLPVAPPLRIGAAVGVVALAGWWAFSSLGVL